MEDTAGLKLIFFVFCLIFGMADICLADGAGTGSQVIITSEHNTVEIGEAINITGQIDPSLLGNGSSDLIIMISPPENSQIESFILVKPDENGFFSTPFSADVSGDWGFEALYNGYSSEKHDIIATTAGSITQTQITISGWPTYPKVGEVVALKGRLTNSMGDGINDENMKCEVSLNHDDWKQFTDVQTDEKGEFAFEFPVMEKNDMDIKVSFEGNDIYSRTDSNTVAIKITE